MSLAVTVIFQRDVELFSQATLIGWPSPPQSCCASPSLAGLVLNAWSLYTAVPRELVSQNLRLLSWTPLYVS